MRKYTTNTVHYFSLLFFVLSFLCLTDLIHDLGHIVKINTTFILIHLLTGIGLLIVTTLSTVASIRLIRLFGLAYLLISLIGFQIFQGDLFLTESHWSHVFYLNLMNYIHFIIGIVLSLTGAVLNNQRYQTAILGSKN